MHLMSIYLSGGISYVHLKLCKTGGMFDRVMNNPNITVHSNTETVDVISNTKGQMSGVLVRRTDSGEESVLDVKGLFYRIGHMPNSQLLHGQVEIGCWRVYKDKGRLSKDFSGRCFCSW